MVTATSESSTTPCSHCGKDVPTSNIDLHFAYCSRNLEKCTICGDMVPKKNVDEHYHNTHAPVECSLCSQTVERKLLDLHKGEKCPQRIMACEYCEFPLPAVDLYKHQDTCANRTQSCNRCDQYVRLCEWNEHQLQPHFTSGGTPQSPRVGTSEGDGAVHRRQAHNVSQRSMMFTIAITGAAFLIGSFFLQKSIESHQPH